MSAPKEQRSTAPWWAALGVGALLIAIPEPGTTAIGIAIVLGTLGTGAVQAAGEKK